MSNATEPTKPKCFYCYLDDMEILKHLSNEEAGIIWKALFKYADTQEETQFNDKSLLITFGIFKQQINRDFQKYKDRCEKNRANASKRKRTLTSANERNQSETTISMDHSQREREGESEREREREGESNAFQAELSPPDFYNSAFNDFNRICKSLPRVDKLTEAECSLIEQAESILNNISFAELFKRVESSDYLCNRTSKKWNCTFKWILEPEHLRSILQGAYDNDDKTAKLKNEQSTEEFIKAYNRYEDVFNDDKSSDAVNPLFAELFEQGEV